MFAAATALEPRRYLESIGRIFACFDRQDSGNVSFGVEAGGKRYFAKTAGPPGAAGLPTSHAERLGLHRQSPSTARQRFLSLPWAERLAAVRAVVDLHRALAAKQWVVGDFYDGCLLYDFAARRIAVFDLDHYQQGPYRNTMGRMFGSTRFMAPEEFQRGRLIDERTTVFAMGRLLSEFLGDRVADVVRVACAANPKDRYASVEALWTALCRRSAASPR